MTHKAPLISDLKSRRQSLGWSTTQVSERCGIDEQHLADWECGIAMPPLDAVEHWAGALGLKIVVAPEQSEAGQGLKVDWQNRRVCVDGAPVRLTPMEWKALERLARVPGELVTHQDLFRHLYGDERHYRSQSTAVRVLITKLRRLLPLRIEAQWRRGYVVKGLPPSHGAADGDDVGPRRVEPEPAKPVIEVRRDCKPMTIKAPVREQPIRHDVVKLGNAAISRFPAPAANRAAPCRAEELGVIEQFLAERGVTRCPDLATIQQSPLPTLVWDKVKRKWVRPALAERAAS